MERMHESLSIEDLERFEHSHSITIPREYRDFYWNITVVIQIQVFIRYLKSWVKV